MHLARESDASDVRAVQVGALERERNSDGASAPPIVRMLFRPADLGRGKGRVFFRGRSDYAPLLVDDKRSRSAGSNVNS